MRMCRPPQSGRAWLIPAARLAAPSAPGSGAKAKKGKKLHITEFLKPEKSGRWADDDLDDSNRAAPLRHPLLQRRRLRPAVGPGTDTSASCSGWPGALAHRARRGAVVLCRRSVPAGRGVPAAASPASVEMLHQQRPFSGRAEQIGTIFYPELKVRRGRALCMPAAGARRRAAALHNPRPRRAQVVDVLMLHHHDTGNAKGCFVEFDTREDLEKALQKNGTVRQQRARRPAAAARGCVGARGAPQRGVPLTAGRPRQVVSGRPINVDVAEERPSHSRGAGPGDARALGVA